MNMLQSTWSPFQSPEVREICAHLTHAERKRILANAQHQGKGIALWIAAPGGIVAGSFAFSWQLGMVLLAVYAVSGWPRLRAMRCVAGAWSYCARLSGQAVTTVRRGV